MTVGVKKAVVGMTLSVIGAGCVIPLAFWALSSTLDAAFRFGPLLGPPLAQMLAAAFILIGAFWISWAYSYLLFVGKGLPLELFGRALHPTKFLVTTGPYAYSRNPVILGILFVLLGVACLTRSVSGLALVPILAIVSGLYLSFFEEKGLVARFGAEYEEYRGNVPLIVPRFTPYIHETAR